jgi:hypothetical protein
MRRLISEIAKCPHLFADHMGTLPVDKSSYPQACLYGLYTKKLRKTYSPVDKAGSML